MKLDEELCDDQIENYYKKKSVYIIHYPKFKKALVSFSVMGDILDYNIMHSCSTETRSSGSPILNLSNKKIIGVHKQGMDQFNFNKGIFLKYPINDFKALMQSNFNNIKKMYHILN